MDSPNDPGEKPLLQLSASTIPTGSALHGGALPYITTSTDSSHLGLGQSNFDARWKKAGSR